MPLDDLDPNIPGSASVDGVKPQAHAVDPATSTTSLRSSAVQSMLRTTTELGDSGPFAVRPPRIPRSASRMPSRVRRSGSYDASFASNPHHSTSQRSKRPHRPHGPRPVPSSSGLSGRETITSAATSHHSGLRSKRVGPRYRAPGIAGPPTSSHSLYTHRSLVTLRSQRDMHSLHAGSPMMHSWYGRRHAHRTSSPAFSEAHSSRLGLRRPYHRVGSAVTVASSPPRSGLPGYRPDLGGSVPSLIRLPSPAISAMAGAGMSGPIHRSTTPMSHSLQSLRATGNHSAASYRGLPQSPTGSTTPHYYDYSEVFEEDYLVPSIHPHVADAPHGRTPAAREHGAERRLAQSPFGTMAGSSFKPVELPAAHNRRPSEQSKYSYTGVIPQRVSSLAATTKTIRRAGTAKTSGKSSWTHDREAAARCSRDERDNSRASTASRRTSGSTHASAFFPNASRSPRDLTTLAARVHSPVLDHQFSAKSIDRMLLQENADDSFDLSRGREASMTRASTWELPPFAFRPFSCGSPASDRNLKRPSTSACDAGPAQTVEIVSPVPARPMSSQSRKRFSHILEIDEDYAQYHNAATRHPRTYSRLHCVEEQPDLHYLETVSSARPDVGSNISGPDQPAEPQRDKAPSPARHGNSPFTIHDKSTVESLLDRHIECLGLNDVDEAVMTNSAGCEIDAGGSTQSTVRLSSTVRNSCGQAIHLRPMTSSSFRHSSLASSERRRLIPRRLFASMDASLPPGAWMFPGFGEASTETGRLLSMRSAEGQRLSGWQTLPSTSELRSSQSAVKNSLTSGDMGDVDSNPPLHKFKIRRCSELTATTSTSSKAGAEPNKDKDESGRGPILHRRSQSDLLSRQLSHQRRRMRILLKAKRKSASVGHLVSPAHQENGDEEEHGPEDDWTTVGSSNHARITSPPRGYAELSAESALVPVPSMLSPVSGLEAASAPRRWTSMLATVPEPVKKGMNIVRKASGRTVRSHRSNTSIIEPLNSTRMSSQIPRVGSVPQLEPPEFGPPLTSSDLHLSLRFPDPPQVFRPPLREVQSFFSDDSSVPNQRSTPRKRFDLHSIRSGWTRSSGRIGPRQHGALHQSGVIKASHSLKAKSPKSLESPAPAPDDTIAMTDFAYKKKKVIDRVKEWWKRQCMQRSLSFVRKRDDRGMPPPF